MSDRPLSNIHPEQPGPMTKRPDPATVDENTPPEDVVTNVVDEQDDVQFSKNQEPEPDEDEDDETADEAGL